MVWRIGDFGRFKIEIQKYPRFEVIASDRKSTVTVWYSGRTELTTIPRDVFLEDCVNWWVVDKIAKPEEEIPRPRWCQEGGTFKMHAAMYRALNIEITQITDHKERITTTSAMDANGREFTIRRFQRNYVSCLATNHPKVLLLIPLTTILKYGHEVKDRWEMIRNRDILDPNEEDL